jgi:hypothetical protein
MLKRLRYILIWTCAFYLGSLAILFGAFLFSGTYSRITGEPSAVLSSPLWDFFLPVATTAGFLLGVFGKLPGTRAHQKQ